MKQDGKTIAVLGSGFNYIYPNKEVFNEILKNKGAIITEYAPDTRVFPQGFRDRNRIVAALSIGTLVVEAKERSGTSITIGYAKKYGRHIFCIPHTLDDRAGIGTNRALKHGAELVTEVNDILKYFNKAKKKKPKKVVLNIPKQYLKIYEVLEEALNADEIIKKVKMPINKINILLTMMELEGYIKNLPGGYYERK